MDKRKFLIIQKIVLTALNGNDGYDNFYAGGMLVENASCPV